MTDQQIKESLAPFGIIPTDQQATMIREYTDLLLKWNKSLNLTSLQDPLEIVARHFGESMFLSKILPVENCRLADVGTGPGFPGLAIKLLSQELQLTLIESNRKKCAFLSEVVRSLPLANIKIIPSRYEDLGREFDVQDLITARALGDIKDLLKWAKSHLTPAGEVVLWLGGTDAASIAEIKDWEWKPAIRIPESQRRFLLIGSPSKK